MKLPEQPAKAGALRLLVCFFCLPFSVYAGLLLHATVSPGFHLTGAFAIWMAIFVGSIFLPAHLLAFTAIYLLLRNRFASWRPHISVLLCCVLVAIAIGFSRSTDPFSLVFSWATIPLFICAYVIASGRGQPDNAYKSTPQRSRT